MHDVQVNRGDGMSFSAGWLLELRQAMDRGDEIDLEEWQEDLHTCAILDDDAEEITRVMEDSLLLKNRKITKAIAQVAEAQILRGVYLNRVISADRKLTTAEHIIGSAAPTLTAGGRVDLDRLARTVVQILHAHPFGFQQVADAHTALPDTRRLMPLSAMLANVQAEYARQLLDGDAP